MADKIPKMPKNVEKWLKNHSVEDLEAALWEMTGKRAETVVEILSMVYDMNDDIVGSEVPKIKALA
jgi:hypothetical protein